MDYFNPLKTGNPLTGTSAHSEDPDEMLHYDDMLHNAAFYQGLNCMIPINPSSEKEIQYYLENYNL